jgi:hypothetical protein
MVTDENGSFCNPHNFTRWWRDFRDKYNLADFRLHRLASYSSNLQATQLIAAETDLKTIQNRLGYLLGSTTLDIRA